MGSEIITYLLHLEIIYFHLKDNQPTVLSYFRTVATPTPDQPGSPLLAIFEEYARCPQHRSLILTLCSIIQTTTIQCPGALVWHNLGEGKNLSPLYGSPLDMLPCPPSCLPLPFGVDNQEVWLQKCFTILYLLQGLKFSVLDTDFCIREMICPIIRIGKMSFSVSIQ